MIKNKIFTLLILVISTMLILSSCENDDDDGDEKMVSKYNEMESHKMGENCMSCHKSGGEGEGWFNLAGTVYDSEKTITYPNATVKIYNAPNGGGSLIGTIEVDGLGNFYTTDNIDFENGLYVTVTGDNTTEHMLGPVITGQCNSCHGTSTARIWTR